MNTPSYNVLLNKEKLIKTVQELCENVNGVEGAVSQLPLEVGDDNALYIIGVGGYDGTNAGESGVKSLQQVLEDLAE